MTNLTQSLALLGRYLAISVRGQMQYRASFLMLFVGSFFISLLEFVTVVLLFDRFGQLRDWSLAEVALLYGLVNVAFSLAEATSQGFEHLSQMVRRGDFDRILLRPRSAVLQIAGQQLHLRRFGRMLQGAAVLLWALHNLDVPIDAARIALLTLTLLGGTCLFYGLFVLEGTMSFWTIESLELWASLTNGGVFAAQYPMSMYRRAFRWFFTFLVPLAGISYYPGLALSGRIPLSGAQATISWVAPLSGILFLLLSLAVWRIGVRRYTSTGS
ncbi:MAG: ABC transporter permease [Gemmatimonadetes bacterium]|jgi:ABC-2 type transport system permease protein|nr:ABC transporter permease [Gemmatimonadota bacterium]MBT6143920.1 ABC transporter permease [Gemmatimonadota bacterium]MBT7860741.1 ABC transporter permease [Gemmatimonadota bacterium]